MLDLRWRTGSIAEVVALSQRISEFDAPYGINEYQHRLQGRVHLIQIAEVSGEVAGFYVSYAKSEQEFYLWMSAVLPDFRGLGLASLMLEGQQQWAKQHGFQHVTVKSRNRYASKLKLLIGNGFQIVDLVAKADDPSEHRIFFDKQIA